MSHAAIESGPAQAAPGWPDRSRSPARCRTPGRPLVLLVSTEADSAAIARAWSGQAADVRPCPSPVAALVLVGRMWPDMVVIGDPDGPIGPVEFLRAVREVDVTVPVIVGVDDRQQRMGPDALSAGATAVVPRPFCAGDLLRRLHATAGDAPPIGPLPLDVGRLRVDGAAPRMWLDGVETVLPPLEFRLLRYLAERQGEILPRRELLIAAWGDRPTVSSNSLSVHLARLRGRLGRGSGAEWIRPIRGIGYQLLVPPRLPTESAAGGSRRRAAR